jgi:hypothetical protein
MNRIQRHCLLVAALLGCLAPVHPAAAQAPLRVGFAEVDITPPVGYPLAGYFHERLATGTLDPLKARVVVFRSGDTQAALVVCDLCAIAVDLSGEVRRRAAAKTGIPAAHIAVAATHSHTSADYNRDLYAWLGAGGKGPAGGAEPYAARLLAAAVEAIAKAHERAEPAVAAAGSARQEPPVSFNRRFVMKDGSVRTWMSLANPEVVRPAGPIDPEIGLVLLRSADGIRPLGLLSNFALHLDTVGGTRWSADYPSYLEQAFRKQLGPDLVSMFAVGCCGDVNHIDPARKDRNTTEAIGRALAETAGRALPGLTAVGRPTLRVRQATARLPLREVTAEQVARARPLLLDARAGEKVDFLELVAAHRSVVLDQLRHKAPYAKAADVLRGGLTHTWAGVGDYLPAEVQVIGLGADVAIVCLPGEVFAELGLAIKRASPFATTLLVELANCSETGYIPARAAYAGGGYEVINSSLAPGSGEALVEAAVRLLRDVAGEEARAARP